MDDIRMIKLTMNEIKLIQEALFAFNPEGTGWEQSDLNELSDDIREQNARPEWGWPEPTTEENGSLVGNTFRVAEDDFIDAGIMARERLKEIRREQHNNQAFGEFEVSKAPEPSSRPFADTDTRTASLAAQRRNERLMKGTAMPCVSEFMNDPIDW